jgi:hypothetical protein
MIGVINPRRSAEQITADVLAHLPPCQIYDQRCGNVILLHDGGEIAARRCGHCRRS